ncbi:hypothetical protein LTR17_026297 [Elasticomyces elasticus]|nr:hypothetical protein LTR17_026297 [Elasticomyces elasticus]
MPAYTGTLYAVGSLVLVLRLWLRVTKQAGALGLDDAFMLGAWLAGTMFFVVTLIFAESLHIGRHVWDIPLDYFEEIALLSWLAQFSFLITGACTKISVLLFYRRLVKDTIGAMWKAAVIAAIVFTAAYTFAFMLMLIFNCNPTEAYWKSFDIKYSRKYTCVDTTVVNLLAGIFAIISDIYAVVLPMLMTRHFSLAAGQKIALNIIFSLGILVVAASAARTYYFYEVGHNSDVSPMIFNATAWSQLELQLGMVCASLPALRVFFRLARSNQGFSMNRSGQGSRGPMSVLPDDPPDDGYQLRNVETKHAKAQQTSVVAAEEETGSMSPSSTTASTRHLVKSPVVKSPVDYEAYNLEMLNKGRSRYSITGRERSDTGREPSHKFSQPAMDRLPP